MKFGLALTLVMLLAMGASALLFDREHRKTAVAFFLAWMIPGAGHLLLGRPVKALALFLILAGLYVTGLWLCGWRHVSADDNVFYYVGQFGSGVTTLLGQLFSTPKAYPREGLPTNWIDPAMLYVSVAGLLNIVVTVGVFEAARPAKTGEGKPA